MVTVAHSCSLHLLFPRELTVYTSMAGLLKGYRERDPDWKKGGDLFFIFKDYLKHAGGTEKSWTNVCRSTSRIQGRWSVRHIENTLNPLKGLPQEPHLPLFPRKLLSRKQCVPSLWMFEQLNVFANPARVHAHTWMSGLAGESFWPSILSPFSLCPNGTPALLIFFDWQLASSSSSWVFSLLALMLASIAEGSRRRRPFFLLVKMVL